MQSMQEYVVRVRRTTEGEYRATLREVAPGVPLDVRTLPTGAASIGTASTHAAAILGAVIAADIPELPESAAWIEGPSGMPGSVPEHLRGVWKF